jgi:DNA polymerase (family 10)
MEKFATEEAFYRRLGLQYIPPEIREDQGEIELAEKGKVPKLVELSDINGDVHVHTNWSDGRDSIEAMAQAAKALGYQYMAITDHSAGRGIAHGLSEERLRQQIEEIKQLNKQLKGIHIFTGTEVDIRADGSMDLPEGLLADLDIVIATIHSAMNQSEEQITKRILGAIENPHIDVIAHPTCRLLGEREPVAIDMEAVFRAAAKYDKALEINAMPSRLDLKDIHTYRARELGVKLIMGTDAHSTAHLGFMRFGVGVARRGWCQAKDILNTRPMKEMLAFLRKN